MKLREQSLNARESISAERAQLITHFYAANETSGMSVPVLRARALEYILRHKAVCINDGELIVGREDPRQRLRLLIPRYVFIRLMIWMSLTDAKKYRSV